MKQSSPRKRATGPNRTGGFSNLPLIVIGQIFYLATGKTLHLGDGSQHSWREDNTDHLAGRNVPGMFAVLVTELTQALRLNLVQLKGCSLGILLFHHGLVLLQIGQ